MNKQSKYSFTDIVRRALWAYVAACAAWRMYPEETTVLPNKQVTELFRAAAAEDK